MLYKKRFIKFTLILILSLTIAFIYHLAVGTSEVAFYRVIDILLGNGDFKETFAVKTVRLPRALASIIIGGALATSGAITQGVTRNDLASPDIIGITSGASFGIVVYLFLTQNYDSTVLFAMPIFAFLGGIISFLVIYFLALRKNLSPFTFVLNGIAVNTTISALIVIVSLKLSPVNHTYATSVLSGALIHFDYDTLLISFIMLVLLYIYCIYKSKCLDVLSLSEELSIGLGINVLKERKRLLFSSVLMASIAAWISGSMSFVGLLAPHMARKLVGANHTRVLIVSNLIGSTLVLISDAVARTILKPEIVPIGLVVSILGAPYMLILLFKKDRT